MQVHRKKITVYRQENSKAQLPSIQKQTTIEEDKC